MKKAAVIGLGDISAIHLAAIARNPQISLAAVCDIDPGARARAPQGVPFFTDYREMIMSTEPDCVHICLPHSLHYPVTRDAAELGCHVFCEKPLAMDPAQAAAFVALERTHPQLRLGICLQNRFNETTEALKAIIDGGQYGGVVGAKGLVPWYRPKAYYEGKPWRGTWREAGGGTMMNQSIHTLDLLYYLCGPVKKVHASVAQLLDYGIEVEDTVTARIEFHSGAGGVFWATNANWENESTQITVALEKALFHIENSVLTRRDPDGTATLLCEDEKLPGTKFYYGASHAKLINQFYAAMEAGTDDYLHAGDGEMSIRLISAIQESGRLGEAVALT